MSLITGTALSSASLSIDCPKEQLGASKANNASPGLAGQVARGSLWSFGGQMITLAVSFAATPLVIRLLGTEAYGVLTLVNLMIGYLAFADLGMGTASTRFGAAAHARRDDAEEAAVIWTALLAGLLPSVVIALLFAATAHLLVEYGLHLPGRLQAVATTALQLAAFGFFVRCAANVLNTPQLTRLRLGLNAAINTVCNVMQIALVPIALLVRRDVVVAIAVIAGANVIAAAIHGRYAIALLPALRHPRLRSELINPMVRFGGALVVSSLASLVIINAEKALLTRFAGVTALAHYSVAVTLAGLLGIAPLALTQALVPAFARLQANGNQRELQALYTLALRGSLLWVAPVTWVLCICAKPFLTVWAGAEYGQESTAPLYVLVVGLAFNVIAYVPYSLLTAIGKTGWTARCHLMELIPYVILAAFLTARFGAVGAALASTLRLISTLPLFAFLARRASGLSFTPLVAGRNSFVIALLVLTLPALLLSGRIISVTGLMALGITSLAGYGLLVWRKVLSNKERAWLGQQARVISQRFAGSAI